MERASNCLGIQEKRFELPKMRSVRILFVAVVPPKSVSFDLRFADIDLCDETENSGTTAKSSRFVSI